MKTKILADSQICISVPLMVSGNDLRRRFSQGKCLTFSQQLLSTEYVNIGCKCQIILNVSIYGIEHSANLSLCANVNSYYCCVCVCVFILFHLLVSSGCTTSVIYVRSSDLRPFVESIFRGFCRVPSSLFLNLSYFTSKDENSSWQLLERKRMI